jgi:hypothetical protein
MDVIREIVDSQKDGMFAVVTAKKVKAFSDTDQCEEYIATLGGQQFAVVRLLWTGGTAALNDAERFEQHFRAGQGLRDKLRSQENDRLAVMRSRHQEKRTLLDTPAKKGK